METDQLTSEDLIRLGVATPAAMEFLRACVLAHLKIGIIGAEDSGGAGLRDILAKTASSEERQSVLDNITLNTSEIQLNLEAFDLLVFMEGGKITQISQMEVVSEDSGMFSAIFKLQADTGKLQPTGLRPKFLDRLEAAGIYLPPVVFGIGSQRPPSKPMEDYQAPLDDLPDSEMPAPPIPQPKMDDTDTWASPEPLLTEEEQTPDDFFGEAEEADELVDLLTEEPAPELPPPPIPRPAPAPSIQPQAPRPAAPPASEMPRQQPAGVHHGQPPDNTWLEQRKTDVLVGGKILNISPDQLMAQIQQPQFSAFYPQTLQANKPYSLLVFVHIQAVLNQVREVAGKYAELMGGKPSESSTTSEKAIQTGAVLTFVPRIKGLTFTPAQQTITWNPATTTNFYQSATFLFHTPADLNTDLTGYILVLDGAVIVGEIPVSMAYGQPQTTTPQEGLFDRYDPIFASYSHQDSPVMEYFRARRASLGQKMLVDIYDLRSGDHWADRLLEMIDQSAVFQLFWSERSAKSKYCRQEWEYALKLLPQRPRFIQPVWWEKPMTPPPPELEFLHFQPIQLPVVPRIKVWGSRLKKLFGG